MTNNLFEMVESLSNNLFIYTLHRYLSVCTCVGKYLEEIHLYKELLQKKCSIVTII